MGRRHHIPRVSPRIHGPPFNNSSGTGNPSSSRPSKKEVVKLESKQAIFRIYPPFQRGFWATFFLAPKKTGDWRPIINLKPLNAFIKPQRFRMETLALILECPIKGRWATSIDLKDAYLHIPIAQTHQKWLRFSVGGQAFAFKSLPFGLSTSPRVFTRVVKSVSAFLRRHGVQIYTYLDDWLILAPSRAQVEQDTRFVLSQVRDLGFIVNLEKSSLVPSQDPVFLGRDWTFSREWSIRL